MSTEILFFSSKTCGPCRNVKKNLNESLNQALNVRMLDADNDINEFVQYQIMSVPTFVKLVDGKETNRKLGYRTIQELKDL